MKDSPQNYDDSITDAACCQRLWQKVLLQVWMDATSHMKGEVAATRKAHSIAWLQSSDEDFSHVCWLAGFSPAYVREKFRTFFVKHPQFDSYLIEKGQWNFLPLVQHTAPHHNRKHRTHVPPRRRHYRRCDKTAQGKLW
jgi:hypothetical protein